MKTLFLQSTNEQSNLFLHKSKANISTFHATRITITLLINYPASS